MRVFASVSYVLSTFVVAITIMAEGAYSMSVSSSASASRRLDKMPRKQPTSRRSEEEEKRLIQPKRKWAPTPYDPRVLEKPKNWLKTEAEKT